MGHHTHRNNELLLWYDAYYSILFLVLVMKHPHVLQEREDAVSKNPFLRAVEEASPDAADSGSGEEASDDETGLNIGDGAGSLQLSLWALIVGILVVFTLLIILLGMLTWCIRRRHHYRKDAVRCPHPCSCPDIPHCACIDTCSAAGACVHIECIGGICAFCSPGAGGMHAHSTHAAAEQSRGYPKGEELCGRLMSRPWVATTSLCCKVVPQHRSSW